MSSRAEAKEILAIQNDDNISKLPETLLENVGSFLARPSRAMFAAAATAPSSSWYYNATMKKNNEKRKKLSATSSAILVPERDHWDVLDFEDVDKGLASKLSDDDLGAILLCLDSGNNKLARLKLAGCINITGRGLEPLRGSVTLKQIDLSMVGQHEIPEGRDSDRIILEEAILLPILVSIVEQTDTALIQIQLPKKWCGYRNRSGPMNDFLQQYEQVLRNRPFDCAGGTHEYGQCFGADGEEWIDSYARQRFTCYQCLENVCDDPAVEVACDYDKKCEKTFCDECR